MSISVMSSVWKSSKQKGNKLLMLLAIGDNANDDGWAYPSINTLAQKVRVNRRNAQKIIDSLEADGELLIYNQTKTSNKMLHFSNVYFMAKYGVEKSEPPHELRGSLTMRSSVARDTTPVKKVVSPETLGSVSEDTRVVSPETPESSIEPSTQPSKESAAAFTHERESEPPKVNPEPQPEITLFKGISHSDDGEKTSSAPGSAEPPSPVADDRPIERANIFKQLEDLIGTIPLQLVDELKDAEKEYPADWIVDAFKEAADHNARNWKYVRTILERWKREGRYAPKPASVKGARPVHQQPDIKPSTSVGLPLEVYQAARGGLKDAAS